MSQNGQHNGNERVIDDENSVDAQLKRQIITMRKEVRDAERLLFVEADANPDLQIGQAQRVKSWGTVVKQYLRMIEPLLRADTIDQSKEYYQDVELGSVTLVPQDTEKYRFSAVANGGVSETALRREIGIPRGAQIPKPETIHFNGLRSLIDQSAVLQKQWVVDIPGDKGPLSGEVVRTGDQRLIPREVFETAFRKANLFLQKAGVGLNVDDDSLPAIMNFDMSRDEPRAELSTDDHETPEI